MKSCVVEGLGQILKNTKSSIKKVNFKKRSVRLASDYGQLPNPS